MRNWITRLNGQQTSAERVTFNSPELHNSPEPGNSPTNDIQPHVTPLVHLGILDVVGAGADKLLQGQTSAQIDLANGDFAPLTCFCSAKGRMLANAQLLRISPERYRLILHQGLVQPLQDHLKKFAPFYKSQLEPRDDLTALGIMGEGAEALVAEATGLAPASTPLATWHQAGDETLQLLAHPGPQPRLLLCLPLDRAEAVFTRLSATAHPVGNAAWCLQDIRAGLAWLTPAHQDALLPQMINWEALGGISFKKGCYTGQEVVARAHFRGQVKKRLAHARTGTEQLPELGASVVDSEGKNRGDIVAAELDGQGGTELLVVLNTNADLGPLSVDGQAVEILPLPYPIERLDPEALAEKG